MSLLAAGVGGTPVIVPNGNRRVGQGHDIMVEDPAGRWWTLCHAVDEDDFGFAGAVGLTKRPVLLDRIDWVDGRPVPDGGAGPSDGPRAAPALRVGEASPPVTMGLDGVDVVQVAVRPDVPVERRCFNDVQAGLVIHGDDHNDV